MKPVNDGISWILALSPIHFQRTEVNLVQHNKSFKADAVDGTRNGSSLALLSVILKAVPALKACAA
jgi:hypothetical protein